MNKEQILAKIREMMAKQQAIVDKGTLSDEDTAQFQAYQKNIDGLKNQLQVIEAMEANNRFMDEPTNRPVIPADMSVQQPVLDNGGFASIGEFVNAVRFGDSRGRIQNLSTGDVGILIPPAFSEQILQLNPEREIVMPRATNIPAGSPPDAEFTIPYFQQGGDGANGGISLTWTAEDVDKPDVKDPVLKDLTLRPQEASGCATISNKTLINWTSCGAFIQNLLSQAWRSGRDYKFLRGSGAGCPMGILNAPGAIEIARDTAATIKYIDCANMLARMLPDSLATAVFVANITIMPKLLTLQDGVGNYIFSRGDATKGIAPTLLGLPILWNGKQPTVGNRGDLALVDFQYYLTKAGSGPYISASEHVLFKGNKTVIKIVANIDGQPWVKDPLKLEDGSTTVSPYIILK